MARLIGSDCTKGALEWQFRRYKAGGKLQLDAVENGRDPKDINVDVNPQGKPDSKGSGGGKSNCTSFCLSVFVLAQHNTARPCIQDMVLTSSQKLPFA